MIIDRCPKSPQGFQLLEQRFDVPTVFVYGHDGSRLEIRGIGGKDH